MSSKDISAAPAGFDWAASMDATRHACGNDTAVPGQSQRGPSSISSYPPDPQDGLSTGQVAELAGFWALKHFADFEVAIVLHDDNERRIPHATSSSTTPTSSPNAGCRPPTRWSSTAAFRSSPRSGDIGSCGTRP